MSIKKRIQEINNPAVHSRRNFTTTAKVLKINEKANTCEIQYLSNDGYYTNKSDVSVQLYIPGLIGWFPEKDDTVTVQIIENYVVIIGPLDRDYASKTRNDINTKKDILTANYGGTMAGHIF